MWCFLRLQFSGNNKSYHKPISWNNGSSWEWFIRWPSCKTHQFILDYIEHCLILRKMISRLKFEEYSPFIGTWGTKYLRKSDIGVASVQGWDVVPKTTWWETTPTQCNFTNMWTSINFMIFLAIQGSKSNCLCSFCFEWILTPCSLTLAMPFQRRSTTNSPGLHGVQILRVAGSGRCGHAEWGW